MYFQLTNQAKKAAGDATKSVQEASKNALEASKTVAGVSKHTLDDLTYVGKATIGDITKSAKEAALRKGLKTVPKILKKNFTIQVICIVFAATS